MGEKRSWIGGGVGWLVAATAFIAPPAIALLLSSVAFSNQVVPDVALQTRDPELSVNLLSTLAQSMLTMSAGLAAASTWIYQKPLIPSLRSAAGVLLSVAMLFAFIAFYAGLRFLYDMAQQLRFESLDFEPLASRLYWQGGSLVFQVSALAANGVLHYWYGDKRFRKAGN